MNNILEYYFIINCIITVWFLFNVYYERSYKFLYKNLSFVIMTLVLFGLPLLILAIILAIKEAFDEN